MAKKYDIPTIVPEDVERQLKRKKTEEVLSTKRRKTGDLPKPRWPIEDTEIVFYVDKDSHPENATTAVPIPCKDFTLPHACVPDLLQVWSFLFNYSEPLKLSPFSLDDFEGALRFSDDEEASPILMEILMRLMAICMDHTSKLRTRQIRLYRYVKNRPKARDMGSALTGDSMDSTEALNAVAEADDEAADDDNQQQNQDENQDGNGDEQADNGKSSAEQNSANQSALKYLLEEEKWWKIRLKPTTVIETLICCLFSHGTVWDVPNILEIMQALTENHELDVETLPHSYAIGHVVVTGNKNWRKSPIQAMDYYPRFARLSIADKLAVLRVMIMECVVCSDDLHYFMDRCEEQALEYRKEKRDLEVQRKQKYASLTSLYGQMSSLW